MTKPLKILLVSNGFYPEISPRSYRATELAKEFTRLGHSVTVLTKYRSDNYSDFLNQYPVVLKMWPKSRFKPMPQFSNKVLSVISSLFNRIMLMLFEYPAISDMFSVKKMLRNENGYDLLISFSVPYPVHWGVAWSISSRHKIAATWVADCGDPYMGDVLDTFRKLFYFGYLEKWFCRKANFITIPIDSAINAYYPEFHNKIRVIPQGFQFELSSGESNQPINETPIFAYAGAFIHGVRDPRPLLSYLLSVNVPFKFIVYTNTPEFLNDYKDSLKEKLIINGFIPRAELLNELSKADFLINFDNNTKLNSPSKLIDYAIVNRPVMNIERNFNYDIVLKFLSGNYDNRMIIPDPMQYHISKVANQFLYLLAE